MGARDSKCGRLVLSLIALLVPLAVFLIGFRYNGSGDTQPAELLPISLIRERNLDFNEYVNASEELPYWFRRVHGCVVSNYPILTGLLNVPVYLVADALGVDLLAEKDRLSMISASLISAISVLFLYLCLTKICSRRRTAFFFALVYAFATCVWSVASRAMWQHGPSLLLLSIGLWLLLANRGAFALAGLFLGFAVVNRPANFALALPLAIYVFRNGRRSFSLFIALAAIPVILNSVYAWHYWGTPFSLGRAEPVPQVANFGGNPLTGLAGLLFSPSRGLFVFSPVFLFSLIGAAVALRRRRDQPIYSYLLFGVGALILVYSKWTIWWGGHTFGYRFLIETLLALTIFLAIAWEETVRHQPVLRVMFFSCLVWSVFVHFLGARVHPSGFNEGMDENPALLWSIRDSELVMSAKKLLLEIGLIGQGQLAFIFVRSNERAGGVETAAQLSELPEILEVHHVAGEDCFLVKVRARDAEGLGRLLRERLGRIAAITSTRTTIVLEVVKETAALPLPAAEAGEEAVGA